jgi:hypothetical protein
MQTPEDKVYEASQKWISESSRFEKVEFLEGTLSTDYKAVLFDELISWVGEDVFDAFFKRYVSLHGILTPPELEFHWNSGRVIK